MRLSIVITAALLFAGGSVHSQFRKDSISVNVNIVFGLDRYFPVENANYPVNVSSKLLNQRQRNNLTGVSHSHITDIPQFHASAFAGLLTRFTIANGYSVSLDLFAENRGQSFGSLNSDVINVYPQIQGSLTDTLLVFRKDLVIHGTVGDMPNYQLNNGLTVQGVDVPGGELGLYYNSWEFKFFLAGDLSQHVGLNVGDLLNYSLSKTWQRTSSTHNVGASAGFYNNIQANIIYSLHYLLKNPKYSVYSEVGCRAIQSGNLSSRLAAVVGFSNRSKNLKSRLSYQFDSRLRYYGSQFNTDFYDSSVAYRNREEPIHGNYSSNILYPLISSYRSFSQWAVYTEHQNNRVIANEIELDAQFNVFKKLYAFFEYEGNYQLVDEARWVAYNFYKAGISLMPANKLNMSAYATNKILNLDLHYQTFYQSEKPIFGFSFTYIPQAARDKYIK